MKLFLSLVAAFVCSLALAKSGAAGSGAGPGWTGGPIPMVFSGSEVGNALKALGLRTGINVVYVAGKEKPTVTLNVIAGTPEEGVRCLSSAAGLIYRKVGQLYVVAAPAEMRQALDPYCVRATLPVSDGKASEIAPQLQEAFPYATIRASGDGVAMLAVPDDVAEARNSLDALVRGTSARKIETDIILVKKAVPNVIAPLLTSLFADVKVTPTAGDKPGGALAIAGPAISLPGVKAMAEKLDAEMGGEASVFKVYSLRYARAQQVLDLLKQAAPKIEAFAGPTPYLPKRANFNPLTSALSGSSSTSTTGAGMSSQTNNNSDNEGSNAASTAGGANAQADERANAVVLRGRQADIDDALRLVAQIDRKPKQVMVEVNVVETSPENDEAKGLLYNWTSFNFVEAAKGTLVSAAQSATKAPGLGGFSRTPWNFNAVLSALVTKKEAKILAKPSVRVIDNGQASVFIGDTLRSRIVTGGALGAQNVEIREFPVGIILLLAPRVNADGNITMHVNPVVSTVTSIDASNIPQTSSREAETTAILKDGETVVLGGLIRDEDIKTMQEVPILSKLPFFGELFRNRSRNHRRSDILVSITCHIIDGEPEVLP